MRSTYLSAATLAATLAATPALAQDASAPRVTPPATAGLELGQRQLRQAEQRLQQVADWLQQAARSNDRQKVDEARRQAREALAAVRQALDQLPPGQRQQAQQQADRAEQELQGQDVQAGTQAVFALVDVVGVMAIPTEQQQAQAPSEPENPLYAMRAEELIGQTIFGVNGEEIGGIDQVVVDRQGSPAAVVGVGGFLGIGERDVAVPLDQLEPYPGDRLITGMARDQIGSMAAYDISAYQPVDGDTTISEVASG